MTAQELAAQYTSHIQNGVLTVWRPDKTLFLIMMWPRERLFGETIKIADQINQMCLIDAEMDIEEFSK